MGSPFLEDPLIPDGSSIFVAAGNGATLSLSLGVQVSLTPPGVDGKPGRPELPKGFSWPGLGKLIVDSITSLDRPVMVAYLMLVSALFVVINLCVDLAYAVLDPRLRHGRH